MEYEEAVRKVQEACSRRGVTGIKDLGRTFRIYDGNKDRQLSFEDFSRGLDHYGCYLTEDEVRTLFDRFDCDRNGTVDCGEFFYQIRPAMPRVREALVLQAFDKMDVDKVGEITVRALERNFNVTKNPKYLSGELTAKQAFLLFVDTFELDGDDVVTKDEWFDYYSGVSASIDQDVFFDFMMRQSWKM